MNILNKLTIKHLIMNKKRTLVSIIGIILSTALMVGIGLLISTILTSERLNAIKTYGNHHVSFNSLKQEDLNLISKNINVSEVKYYVPLGFTKVDSSYDSKPYIYITEGSKELLNSLNIIEGSLPTNDQELLISSNLILKNNASLKVGDTVTFDIGSRIVDNEELDISYNYSLSSSWDNDILEYNQEEININLTKTYKIVGIVAKTPYESFSDAGVMAFSLNTNNANKYNAFVEFAKPKKTYEYTNNILNILSEKVGYEVNQNILYYYGVSKYSNINETIMPLLLIALSVISVGCIIVIYNSFAISAMERKKSFGIYSSIGATPKQIKKTVLYEAFIVGFIGIVIGIIGAFCGIYIVSLIINHLLADALGYKFIFSINLLYIIIPLIFMVIVIFISAYLPARRSSKVSPIVAIRGNDDIKISKKEVKAPKYITKIFGIEGNIAYKNIKRNKKKYRITIISLFISIVMFNTFTSFLSYIIKSSDTVDYYDYDLGLDFSGSINDIKDDIAYIKSNYNLTKSLRAIDLNSPLVTNFTKQDLTEDYQEFIGFDDNQIPVNLIVLTNEDYNKITDKEALLLNNKYITLYNNNDRKTKNINVFTNNNYDINIKMGDNIYTLEAYTYNEDIYGLKNFKYQSLITMIISENTYFNKLNFKGEINSMLVLNSKEYKQIYEDIKNKEINFKTKVSMYSPEIEMANVKNLILAIKILVYGFITLVTSIGVTSVINTINTNINLRRKEFAMLRSIGLTPKGFNKLLFFESLFFGLKSLIYGIPVSLAINFLIALSINNVIETKMIISWSSLLISVLVVFLIVIISMNYASKKIKRENILEALREENI